MMRARYQGTKCADGRWKIVLTLTAENGGKFKKPFYAPSQKAVQKEVQQFLAGNESRRPVPTMTLSKFLDFWLVSREAGWSENTSRSYKDTVRLYLKPHLGNRRLADLSPFDVEGLCLTLKADGKTRVPSLAREVLRTALRFAVKNRLIPNNAADLADSPGYESLERPMLRLEELRKILAWEGVPLWRALWVFMAETGFRPSEARALHLSELLEEEDGWWIGLKNAKTKASRKPRPISRALHRELMNVVGDSLFVFANPETGLPYGERAVTSRWEVAVKHALNSSEQILAGLENPSIALEHRNTYQLRKLFARRTAKRVSDHVLKQLMGHTDIRTTKVYYLEAEKEELRRAICQEIYQPDSEEVQKA